MFEYELTNYLLAVLIQGSDSHVASSALSFLAGEGTELVLHSSKVSVASEFLVSTVSVSATTVCSMIRDTAPRTLSSR